MRKIILLLILILCATQVLATQNINLLQFNYNDGQITLINSKQVTGHYPDRLLEKGATLQIRSANNQILYTTQVSPPLIEYTDIGTQEGMKGSVIVRNNVNFTIAAPSFENQDHILILNSESQTKKISLVETQILSPKKMSTWLIIVPTLALIIILIIIFVRKSKKEIV